MKYKHCCFLDEVNSSSHVAVLRVCERVVNSVAYIIVIIISWSATRKWSAQVSSLSLFPSHLSYTSASITCLSRVNCCYYYWQAPPQLVFLPSLCPIFVSPLSACLSLFFFGHPGSAGFTIWALLNSVKPFHQFFQSLPLIACVGSPVEGASASSSIEQVKDASSANEIYQWAPLQSFDYSPLEAQVTVSLPESKSQKVGSSEISSS